MFTKLLRKSATLLPSNTIEWGNYIISELVNRLPEIDGRIEEFKLVYSNPEGDGLGLVIYRGAKAFTPTVVRAFKASPIDTIFCKEGRETVGKYLSKRNVVKLLINSSLGKPVGSNAQGVNANYVNLLSPAGGAGGYTSNPVYGLQGGSLKSASWAAEEIKNYDFWKGSELIESIVNPAEVINYPSYVQLSKTASGGYRIFSHAFPEGRDVNQADVSELFDTVDNPGERFEKAASLESCRHVVFGRLNPRRGNIFLEEGEKFPGRVDPDLPQQEGIFILNGIPTYINPSVMGLDGSLELGLSLAVRLGEFSVGPSFKGFRERNEASGLAEQFEDFLSAEDAKIGDIVTIVDPFNKTVTVPSRVLMKSSDVRGTAVAYKLQPMFGMPTPVTIAFENVDSVLPAGNNAYIYPLTSQMRHLPSTCKSYSTFSEAGWGNLRKNNAVRVMILKGGGDLYDVLQDGNAGNPVTEEKLFFTLCNRFGADAYQARAILKKVGREGRASLLVNIILDNAVIRPNSYDGIPDMEKAAIKGIFKLASDIKSSRYRELYKDFSEKYASLDPLLDHYFDIGFSKEAGALGSSDENTNMANSADSRVNKQVGQLGSANYTSSPEGLMTALMKTTAIEKNTREMIDQLSYYALGKIRPEEKRSITISLQKSLTDAENLLCKLLLFTQLEQMPGQDYSDIKILLSDIDSFLSNLSDTMVLLE